MKRRQWLGWGCTRCVGLGGLGVLGAGLGLAHGQTSPVLPGGPDWQPPGRFAAPDLASDEGGLWALMDREERRLRRSPFRMTEPGLAEHLSAIACKLGGAHCPDIRVYPVRAPYFNASMAPNGMMQVWSGLLLRMDNEAQLAAVLGHEIGHYLQRHTVEQLRDLKSRAAFGQFMGMFGLVGLVGQLATLAGAFAFSREHEREADRIGVRLVHGAGYDPREASVVWANLLDELKANPDADPTKNSVLFATHPPSDERRDNLRQLADGLGGQTFEAEYRARLAPLRPSLLADEHQRGRPHETVALLTRLLGKEPGQPWLLHYRGEAYRQRGVDGDAALALADLQAAAAANDAPALSQRSLGQIHRASGQNDAARQAFSRYLALAPDAPDAAMIQQTLQELPP